MFPGPDFARRSSVVELRRSNLLAHIDAMSERESVREFGADVYCARKRWFKVH